MHIQSDSGSARLQDMLNSNARRRARAVDHPVAQPRTVLDVANRLLDRIGSRRWGWSQTL